MPIEMITGTLPAKSDPAYGPHASGLLVPTKLSREREVWTRSEWQALERATKLLNSRGLELFIGCTDARCKAEPVRRIRRNDGGLSLQCAHKTREVYKSL